MPFVKDSLSLLIECAESDLKTNTKSIIRESSIRSGYESIPKASQFIRYDANIVPVISLDGEYYTEMNFLYPFMQSNGIKSISEALDLVAEANELPKNAVGLLIESCDSVNGCIDEAIKKGGKNKDSVFTKIGKALDLKDKLKAKGKKIKTKKECNETCSNCGKPVSECKCKK